MEDRASPRVDLDLEFRDLMLIASERSGVTLLLPNRRLLLSALALEAAGSLRSPAAPYDGAPQQKRNALCRHSPPHNVR